MTLETRLEAEKAALRAEINRLYTELHLACDAQSPPRHFDDELGLRMTISRLRQHYLPQIHILEDRLLDLETTDEIDGLWYKRPLAPGEAQAILAQSLAKG